MEQTSEFVYSGSYSGLIQVEADTFQIETGFFPIPMLNGGSGMMLEVTYKTEIPTYIGFQILAGNSIVTGDNGYPDDINDYFIELPIRDEWTKVYLDLYNPISQYLNSIYEINIVFTNLPLRGRIDDDEFKDSKLLLDNIRIVY